VTPPAERRKSGSSRDDFVVRELRWTDFPSLRELYFLLYEERETNPEIGITLFENRPTDDDEIAWFTGLYRRALSGESVVAVAERDGAVVGSCTVGLHGAAPTSESGHVGVLGILVHRDHRGQGIGRALLSSAIAQSRKKFEIVRLSVFSVNVRARRLYEEFGFRYVGTFPGHVRRGDRYFDEDLMVLDFRPAHANR
jgi:ribosomal protein S18 acetylase RimI-like enzyme